MNVFRMRGTVYIPDTNGSACTERK
jgi:hypothetical protein